MARIIAVHGCTDREAFSGQLDSLWLGELCHALAAYGKSISSSDFTCVSFADLLGTSARLLQRHRTAPGNTGLLRGAAQVCRYISDSSCRKKMRERVADRINQGPSVVIAHSLGSVAAYEALCIMPEHNVHTLITLGSPLGIRQMFFNKLQSRIDAGRHSWPVPLARWVNISYSRDIVPFVKQLSPLFGTGCQIEDIILPVRSFRHTFRAYLSAPVTRRVVADALYGVG